MTDALTGQTAVRSFVESTPDGRASQAAVRSVYNYPADTSRVTQAVVRSLDEPVPNAVTSQVVVRALIKGRVADPKLRVWTYSLDGHDYYVMRLGEEETFVYDLYSEQWTKWTTPDRDNWRLVRGINWTGGTLNEPGYGSNVVAGDDTYGLLWFLSPTQPYDESPSELSEDQRLYFERIVTGQLAVSGRTVVPCYVVHLTANPGEPAYEGAGVQLQFSDDSGQTYIELDEIEITEGTFSPPQTSWYSLGQVRAPGRLFKIIDDGALARIDSLDMNNDG
jgi:hypothetical protein